MASLSSPCSLLISLPFLIAKLSPHSRQSSFLKISWGCSCFNLILISAVENSKMDQPVSICASPLFWLSFLCGSLQSTGRFLTLHSRLSHLPPAFCAWQGVQLSVPGPQWPHPCFVSVHSLFMSLFCVICRQVRLIIGLIPHTRAALRYLFSLSGLLPSMTVSESLQHCFLLLRLNDIPACMCTTSSVPIPLLMGTWYSMLRLLYIPLQ